MTVHEIPALIDGELLTGTHEKREIHGGYTSDLLSDVMGNAAEGNVLITIQGHKNTVAVAEATIGVWIKVVDTKSCNAVRVKSGVGKTNGVDGVNEGKLQATALIKTAVAARSADLCAGFMSPPIQNPNMVCRWAVR